MNKLKNYIYLETKNYANGSLLLDIKHKKVLCNPSIDVLKALVAKGLVENARIDDSQIKTVDIGELPDSLYYRLCMNNEWSICFNSHDFIILKTNFCDTYIFKDSITEALFDTSKIESKAADYLYKQMMLGAPLSMVLIDENNALCSLQGISLDSNYTIPTSATILNFGYSSIAIDCIDLKNIRSLWTFSIEDKSRLCKIDAPELEIITDKACIDAPISYINAPKLKYIGVRALYGSKIQSIDIQDGCIIQEGAFYGCKNLRNVNFLGSVKYIKDGTFYMCHKLRKIEIPEGCTHIGREAFANCQSLSEVKLPETLTYIYGAKTFLNCPKLRQLVLPKSLKHIDDTNFLNFKDLKVLRIPKELYSSSFKIPESCKFEIY